MTKEEVLAHLEAEGAVEEEGNSGGALFAVGSVDHVATNCGGGCCGCWYDTFEEFWKSEGKKTWQIADWW